MEITFLSSSHVLAGVEAGFSLTDIIQFVKIFLADMPGQLALMAHSMGPWLYVVIAMIVFAETGLVVTPLLPGDSLLFAVGAVIALSDSGLSFGLMAMVLIAAVLCGDTANNWFGYWIGPRLFSNTRSKILNPRHLKRTQDFYNRHGGKTIVLARFAPIVRTYAPFVAGLSRMRYLSFFSFSIFGGVAWILIFLGLGFYFGHLPQVKSNFQLVIVGIIAISLVPIALELMRKKESA